MFIIDQIEYQPVQSQITKKIKCRPQRITYTVNLMLGWWDRLTLGILTKKGLKEYQPWITVGYQIPLKLVFVQNSKLEFPRVSIT